MKKCLVIGAGGIGSWLIARLARLQEYNQLNMLDVLDVVDFDEIEEKNLPYQNFEVDDIMDNKALILESKFGVKGLDKRIEKHADLDDYNIIICAVDNPRARELVFIHATKHNKYFIDLRAQGTGVMALTSDLNWSLNRLVDSLGDLDAGDTSCQVKYELEDGIIQLGNTIVAEIGAQMLLNHLRNKKNSFLFEQLF